MHLRASCKESTDDRSLSMGALSFVFICLTVFSVFSITGCCRRKRYYVPIFTVSLIQVDSESPEPHGGGRSDLHIVLHPHRAPPADPAAVHFRHGREVQEHGREPIGREAQPEDLLHAGFGTASKSCSSSQPSPGSSGSCPRSNAKTPNSCTTCRTSSSTRCT